MRGLVLVLVLVAGVMAEEDRAPMVSGISPTVVVWERVERNVDVKKPVEKVAVLTPAAAPAKVEAPKENIWLVSSVKR